MVLFAPLPRSEGYDRDDMEVGWHFHPDAWGNGYATEAAQALVDRAFATGLAEIYAVTHPDNAASQAVCRRLGMTDLGLRSEWYDVELRAFRLDQPRDVGHRRISSATRSGSSSGRNVRPPSTSTSSALSPNASREPLAVGELEEPVGVAPHQPDRLAELAEPGRDVEQLGRLDARGGTSRCRGASRRRGAHGVIQRVGQLGIERLVDEPAEAQHRVPQHAEDASTPSWRAAASGSGRP